MKVNPIPKDADALLSFAEAIATVLSEKADELGIGPDIEALLRARIMAARVGVGTYLVVIARAEKSAVAQGYVALAKARCDRSLQKLRRRLTRTIAYLSRRIEEKDLLGIPI